MLIEHEYKYITRSILTLECNLCPSKCQPYKFVKVCEAKYTIVKHSRFSVLWQCQPPVSIEHLAKCAQTPALGIETRVSAVLAYLSVNVLSIFLYTHSSFHLFFLFIFLFIRIFSEFLQQCYFSHIHLPSNLYIFL